MTVREVTENERKSELESYGIKFALIRPTSTAFDKNILDANDEIRQLLKRHHFHDYDEQLKGPEYKVTLPCLVLSGGIQSETKSSFYRASTRGDQRFWPGRFNKLATSDHQYAIWVKDESLVIVNLSDLESATLANSYSFFDEIAEANINLSTDQPEFVDGYKDTLIEDDESSELDKPSRFEVSSYGWDSDVEGLVKRLDRGDIKLPGFQRGFVWSLLEQSKFIESLILGLPVPNIFLAQDREQKTLNIIDGQQRLRTLQRYLSGQFAISNTEKIHAELRGRYFSADVAKSKNSKVLDEADVRTLSDAVLHSIVIRPDPSADSSTYGSEYNDAVIQIFRRLNTSGKPLQPQEVRSCIFYGSFDTFLHDLNNNTSAWRDLFGNKHSRYKDVEAILRFMALYEDHGNYRAPMPSFLDRFIERNRNPSEGRLKDLGHLFDTATSLIANFDSNLFKNGNTFVLSRFDAVMVGIAKAIAQDIKLSNDIIEDRIARLFDDETFKRATEEFINDTDNVANRINKAIQIFAES